LHYRYGRTELIKGGCHEIARTGLIFPPRQLFGLETIAHRAEPIAVNVNYMVLSNVWSHAPDVEAPPLASADWSWNHGRGWHNEIYLFILARDKYLQWNQAKDSRGHCFRPLRWRWWRRAIVLKCLERLPSVPGRILDAGGRSWSIILI